MFQPFVPVKSQRCHPAVFLLPKLTAAVVLAVGMLAQLPDS
jgi:hypothetical protein